MAKITAKTPDFEYFHNDGTSTPLFIGRDGVTEELILILKNEEHREELQQRYFEEHKDHLDDYVAKVSDKWYDRLKQVPDYRFSPENVVFMDEASSALFDRLRPLVDRLPKAQQNLFWMIRQSMGHTDIARETGRTPGGVRSATNKMIQRLIELYIEVYGEDPRS